MNRHDQICQQLHADFLQRWPLENVEKMTLEDYNSQGNPDSFCAWLERRTKPIGIISGRYSTIFEIFERQSEHAGVKARGFANDTHYTWRKRQGDTAQQAFQNIRNRILEIIAFAQGNDLESIERINDLPPMLRWKIAFMYAPRGSIVAVFAPGRLLGIGQDLGSKTAKIAALHRTLSALKPVGQGIYSFSADLFFRNSVLFPTRNRRYYVIGSKYGTQANEDRSLDMIELSVVSTDFGPENLSLYDYYLDEDKESLKTFLEERECEDLENATNNLYTFLNIRVGDLIAVKASGNPKAGLPYLKIIAYAVVVDRNGEIYRYDSHLGHCLNVEYLETGMNLELQQGGFGKTVNPVKDETIQGVIFDYLFNLDDSAIANAMEKQSQRRRRKGTQSINVITELRKPSAPAVINHHHRTIQSALLSHLQGIEDLHVIAEEDFVDITVTHKNLNIDLYEVKPYARPTDCIREALGQLLDYARWKKDDRIQLYVVGPTVASSEDREFVEYIKVNLRLDFDYKCWPGDF